MLRYSLFLLFGAPETVWDIFEGNCLNVPGLLGSDVEHNYARVFFEMNKILNIDFDSRSEQFTNIISLDSVA